MNTRLARTLIAALVAGLFAPVAGRAVEIRANLGDSVKAGDVTFCPDGTGHALDNTGDTDLVFMALIIKD